MSDSQPPAGSTPNPVDSKDSANPAGSSSAAEGNGAAGNGAEGDVAMEPVEEELPEEIRNASAEDLLTRARMLDNDIRVSPSPQSQHSGTLSAEVRIARS